MLMCSGRAVKLDVDEVGEFDLCCFVGGGMQNDPLFTETGTIILRHTDKNLSGGGGLV